MRPTVCHALYKQIQSRALPEGGFAALPVGKERPDATAWSVLALRTDDSAQALVAGSRNKLVDAQSPEGNVSLSGDHLSASWPTALAVLAWLGAPQHDIASRQGVKFLLSHHGTQQTRKPGDPFVHDPMILGWPWIEGTHAWVEPTVLALLALRARGLTKHERVQQAVHFLLDRQLPHGGWNYGNTIVFGRELHPMPDSTGAALVGLHGMTEQVRVARSLEYLKGEIPRLRTPLSLGWGLLGLTVWGCEPVNAIDYVVECEARQTRYGAYETASLCLLALAASALVIGGDFRGIEWLVGPTDQLLTEKPIS